jgi:murein DD-endopeptidase MepM/ murein hydrolase activator NlpD
VAYAALVPASAAGWNTSVAAPPPRLVAIYKRAGERYGIPWPVLASINAIETDYGRDLRTSPAGAVGWMQFEPATWRAYAVSAGGTGRPDPYDPADAIFTAARFLAANGAPGDLRGAIYAYNHDDWYVDAVLRQAAIISAARTPAASDGYALPLDLRYMASLGRTDDGVDLEAAPDGASVYSVTPGVVTAVASDPGGFGPAYPVIRATAGPLSGRFIYYGHVAACLVSVGDTVSAGEPIAVVGHTGDAAALGHGHLEIGFSGPDGTPLNQHGASAWTPAGAAMREVLLRLASAAGLPAA